MKITAVYGQVHKKNTYKVTQLLLNQLDCGKEDIIELNVNDIPPCCGCTQCINKDEHLCHYLGQRDVFCNYSFHILSLFLLGSVPSIELPALSPFHLQPSDLE